jgi:CRP-like cAMP-binding protein
VNHLETALAGVTFLERLRPDEIGRIARRFSVHSLAKGARAEFDASPKEARLVVVIHGRACLDVETSSGWVRATMSPGDCHGEVALLSGRAHATRLEGTIDGAYATIDRDGLEAILADVPAVALPLAEEMARELSNENDMARQLLELHAEHLPPAELQAAIDERRRDVARRGARVSRLSVRGIFHRLVVARGGEPAFWMLLGFLLALGGARLVVFLILKYGLEKRLFALVQGVDPNPMHVHHFNYGLILIGSAGIAGLVPLGRRALRVLSFVFGVGAGLVFDEFGLIYNLNPEYAQASSLISAAIAASVLIQLAYFRTFWVALARRAIFTIRSGR